MLERPTRTYTDSAATTCETGNRCRVCRPCLIIHAPRAQGKQSTRRNKPASCVSCSEFETSEKMSAASKNSRAQREKTPRVRPKRSSCVRARAQVRAKPLLPQSYPPRAHPPTYLLVFCFATTSTAQTPHYTTTPPRPPPTTTTTTTTNNHHHHHHQPLPPPPTTTHLILTPRQC